MMGYVMSKKGRKKKFIPPYTGEPQCVADPAARPFRHILPNLIIMPVWVVAYYSPFTVEQVDIAQ